MSERIMDEEIAGAAAAWWRRAVEHPKFDNMGKNEPPDRDSEMASIFALLGVPPTSPDVFAAFEREVVKILLHGSTAHDFAKAWPSYVGVDYGPDPYLAEAAANAGLPEARFPWKTSMWIDWLKPAVRVRHGYGAEVQELFPATPSEKRDHG